MNETWLNKLNRQILQAAVDMGDSEENLHFMLFLDNYVPEIEKTYVKKCFLKRDTRNIVNAIYEEILREIFSDVF